MQKLVEPREFEKLVLKINLILNSIRMMGLADCLTQINSVTLE
jgi:hypothetical protein